MNIKELKVLIKDLPDDMPVVECRAGNVGSWTGEPELGVGTVYKFMNIRNYGNRQPYLVEFYKVYEGREVLSEYEALIFKTED